LLAQRITVFGPLTGTAPWVLAFVVRGGGSLTEPLFPIASLVFSILLWVIASTVEGFLRPPSEHHFDPTDSLRTSG